MHMTGNNFMPISEVARKTGVNKGLLYTWVALEKVPHKLGIKPGAGHVKLVSLDAVKKYRAKNPNKRGSRKEGAMPGFPPPGSPSGVKELEVDPEAPPENPMLKAWWDRTVLPLLASQGIRGISWQSGGPLELEVVTKLKL